MKHIFCMILLGLAASISGVKAQELKNSLLWEISGNGLEKPSYLYGTVHITCDASLDNATRKALDNTSLLVLELDMDDPEMNNKMMQGLQMKEGTNIQGLTTRKEYEMLDEFIQKYTGLSLANFGSFKPFFISSMLYNQLLDCPLQSYEQELMKVAHAQNEEVLGLETVAEQLQIFDDIPYSDQIQDLLKSAKTDLDYDKKLFQRMLQIYEEKDLNKMMALMEEEKEASTTKHRHVILDDRNKKWIAKIEAHAKKQPTFFGVGAAHLPGDFGVIQLLRKEGYTVKAAQ
ncbi:TraB/GumN family protein [Spongiimicrobium salis]|uniref:TraB/GumN family protein n=1 Tax=Spongiimicrobium salis TaxID=1667022 RepID=UPI00374CEB25